MLDVITEQMNSFQSEHYEVLDSRYSEFKKRIRNEIKTNIVAAGDEIKRSRCAKRPP